MPWRLADANNFPVEFENKLFPIITFYRYETNTSGIFSTYTQNIEFAKCTNETVQMPEFANKYNLNDYYCMDWSKDNFTLGVYWDGSYVDYFQLFLYFCKDGANFGDGPNCTSIDEVKQSFAGGNLFFDIMYPEYYFVPEDSDNPLRITFHDYF